MKTPKTKRELEIERLEACTARHEASITMQQLALDRARDRQINRLAELRCQKLLLGIEKRAEALAAAERPKI